MLMVTPGDPHEATAATRFLCESYRGPSYLRLGKGGERNINSAPPILDGALNIIKSDGEDAILSCGAILPRAAEAAIKMKTALASAVMWRNDRATRETIRGFVASHRQVLVVEEHLSAGGFGSFVRESMEGVTGLQERVRCLALDPSVCGMVGSADRLRDLGGLTVESMVHALTEQRCPYVRA
jgi:transketolase